MLEANFDGGKAPCQVRNQYLTIRSCLICLWRLVFPSPVEKSFGLFACFLAATVISHRARIE